MSKTINNLIIEKIAMHGYGLGFAENKAVFVPFAMTGDIINANVRLEKKEVIFGSIERIVKPSEDRIQADCNAFAGEHACGGCDWLMAAYQNQLSWKTELIKQTFHPLNLSDKVKDTIPSPEPHFYRNKSFLPAGANKDGLYFGMYEKYSHNVISHKKCLLQPAVMDEILAEITQFAHQVKLEPYNEKTHKGILRHVGIRINKEQNEILLVLVTKGSKFPFTKQFIRTMTTRFPQITGIIQNINPLVGNVILGETDKTLFGSPYLNDISNNVKLRLHYKSFLQINSPTAEMMYSYLMDNLTADDIVLDAFCGIGSIGLFLAAKVKQVHGIEEVAKAISDAEYNQKLNNIENSSFHLGKVEDLLPALMQKHKFSSVVLDPPRKGVEPAALLTIAKYKVPLILYVSCNPMTLARDVAILMEKGYKVKEITPFDMFPQTWHIETAVKLSL